METSAASWALVVSEGLTHFGHVGVLFVAHPCIQTPEIKQHNTWTHVEQRRWPTADVAPAEIS